jgi:hypothetical protein
MGNLVQELGPNPVFVAKWRKNTIWNYYLLTPNNVINDLIYEVVMA